MNASILNLLRLVGVILTASTGLYAQMQTTDPVGLLNLKVVGNGGGTSAAFSYRGLGLTRAVEYQGTAETLTTNTFTDNEAVWADDQFNGANGAHYLEITSGPSSGATFDISATSAVSKRVTLVQNINVSTGPPPISFKIRKHRTIANIFGPNNECGLISGDQASVADQILLHVAGAFQTFYYQVAPPAAGGTGWRNANDSFTSAANTVIYPEDGLILRRNQAPTLNVALLGAVKTGYTSLPILPGQNLVGNVYAANMTLASSDLLSSGLNGGGASSADQVLVWNGTGYNTYYYQTSGIGGVGWRKAGDAVSDASSTVIPVGVSVLINRKLTFGFNWRIPQHPMSL